MNDPHVVELTYIVEHDASVDYSVACSIDHEEEAFRLRIENERVSFQFKEHYPTEDAARRLVDRYVRSWEMDSELRQGAGKFRLRFDRATIIDRNPLPPPPPRPPRPDMVDASATLSSGAATVNANATLTAPQPKPYPQPPTGLTLDPDDPDVLTIYERFRGYLQDREPLTGMAYFCLSMLEKHLSDSRNAAATKYAINENVLGRIGDVTANRGGRAAARKASGIGNALTEDETRFLEEAVKKIIRRTAEVAADPDQHLSQVTLSDLPKLSG